MRCLRLSGSLGRWGYVFEGEVAWSSCRRSSNLAVGRGAVGLGNTVASGDTKRHPAGEAGEVVLEDIRRAPINPPGYCLQSRSVVCDRSVEN
jgi:hypothetical protein